MEMQGVYLARQEDTQWAAGEFHVIMWGHTNAVVVITCYKEVKQGYNCNWAVSPLWMVCMSVFTRHDRQY